MLWHEVPDLEAVRQEHVALLAIPIMQEADPGRPVRVVLDRGDLGRNPDLVTLEVDLLARGKRHDRLAPGCGPARDPAALCSAAFLLGLRREDVDRRDLDLEELLDGRLDLDLRGVAVNFERVLAAAGLVHRLLADDRPDDDVVGGQRHAYTSSRRASAGCSITIVSALSRSTTLSESARRTATRGRFRAERSRRSSRAGETIRTRPATLRFSRTPSSSFVRIASSPKASRTRIASPPNFAVSAPRSARRFIFRGRRWA